MITLNLARGDNYESVPLRLPTTPGEVDEVFAALDAASRYAGEVQIIGVDSGVPSLAKHLKGAGLTDPDAFDKLNRLAEKIGMIIITRQPFTGGPERWVRADASAMTRRAPAAWMMCSASQTRWRRTRSSPMCGPMRSWADMSLLPASSMATGGFPKKRGRIWTLPKSARSILPATAAPILSAAM